MSTVSITISDQELKRKNAKTLMWVATATIVMMFAALTSAYLVSRTASGWMYFELPAVFWYSTAFILMSSVTMVWSQKSIRQDNNKGAVLGLSLTLLLGIGFAICQWKAYGILIDSGIYATGAGSNVSGQYLYIITFLHLTHLAAGLIALFYTLVKASRRGYSRADYTGVEVCSIYWHFLDVLWVYLFVFLLFIR